jgi:3-methyladenine DNA glycosylase AlkD
VGVYVRVFRELQKHSKKYRNVVELSKALSQCLQNKKCFVCDELAKSYFLCEQHAKDEVNMR